MNHKQQNQGNRGHQTGHGQLSEIYEIIKEIKMADSLSNVLEPKKFAPVDGWADKLTKILYDNKKQIKSSQLRKVFNQIKQVCDKADLENKVDLYLIYPNLVYAKARDLIPNEFYELMVACLDKLKESKNKEDYKRFGEFMTAIVAYNKRFREK